MIPSKPVDRLCLQREGAKDITIDLPTHLPQHQLDGIRFLFKLYKKKAPGVILNDPSGYGKCLQTVLFLNAVRPTLKKPILILSNSVNNWIEHFKIWTDCSEELAVEATNPFSKKQVFVNPVKDGVMLSRRSWGIVVLHDEHSTEELLGLGFNADYKIWVTSNDLKGNLYTLASIYEWLHPNQKFHVDQFTAKKSNKRDVVEKALLLDAFLEDFLIRRTNFYCPFQKAENHKPSLPSPVKATRKNKDPTGTKVKRSKKRRIEDEDDNNVNDETNETTYRNNVSTNISVTNATDNNMDVETFIRNEIPIASEGFNFIQNTSTYKNPKDDDDNVGDTMEIDFREAVNDLVENERSINHSTNEDSHDVLASPNIYQGENDATQEYVLEIKENDNKVGILVPATEESENTAQNCNISKNIEDDNVSLKPAVIITETESESSEKFNKIIRNNHSIDREESSQINDCKLEDNDIKNEKSLPEDKDSDKYISINGNKSGADNDNTNSNKELVKNKSKIDELDAELAEFEAKALKKFKNSILDSIF